MSNDTTALPALPAPQPRPGPDRLCGYSAAQMTAYAAAAVAAERDAIAQWLEEQRNDVPATGHEFAQALRAIRG